jgi:outer membrane immunogenic protein
MRHLYLAAVAALLSSIATSSVFAADVLAPPEYDWSGISVGVVGTYNTGKDVWEDGDYPLEDVGFFGGFVGYDHQFGSFVLGARATGQFGSMKEDDYPDFEYQAFYDFNGRAGFAMDRALVYATGGYSVSSIEEDGESYTRGGYNIGGGLEYALTDNVIVGAEYVYRALEADCEPHGDTFEQKISSVQAHVSFKF